MSDQHGRCLNTEFCDIAVSSRIVAVPDGAPFDCLRCGEALEPVKARAKGTRMIWIGVQLAVLAAGGSAVAWKFYGKSEAAATVASVPAAPAPVARPVALVTGSSFVTAQAPAGPGPTVASQAPAPVQAPPPAAPVKVVLRLSGSDALANNVMQRLASGYLSLIGDTGILAAPAEEPGVSDIIGLQGGQREAVRVTARSSDAGFNALLRGTADMAMTTRKVTSAEAERLAPLGDLTNPANEHVIGAQGVAVIVSPANQVPFLTVAQLRGILSGKIKDWSEVRGAPGAIHLCTFDNKDGSADTPEDLLLTEDGVSSSADRFASEQALASAVGGDRAAIGFVTRAGAGTARIVPVAEGSATPVTPTDLAIATEAYPLTRRLYLYTGTDTTAGFGRRFTDYVASPAGQAVVEAAGLVALSLKAEPAALPDAASDRLRQLAAGASRVSVTFRFQPNSTELDSRSARDLDRLVTYLKAQRVNSSRLILAAFADNSGPATVNQAVSQRRADAIVTALTRSGIPPGKVGAFGADLPVADNATADGRERNRRVEVYLAGP